MRIPAELLASGRSEVAGVGVEQAGQGFGEVCAAAFEDQGFALVVHGEVGARGTVGRGSGEFERLLVLQMEQDAFDVLAGVQAVDTKIHAGAVELAPRSQRTDLHGVGRAGGGADGEVREDGETAGGVLVFNGRGLGAGAFPAAGDLLLVRGAPPGVG